MTSSRFPLQLAIEQERVPAGAEVEWQALEFRATEPLRCLELGGLRVDLCGDAPTLGASLDQYWGAFMVVDGSAACLRSASVPALEISLREVERQPFESPVGYPASAERDGQFIIKVRGVALRINPLDGRASALIERRAPLQDLSNLLRACLVAVAPRHAAYLVHAAAVRLVGGGVVLVVGTAQSGKSTVARLASPREVLTDDTMVLRMIGSAVEGATAGFFGLEGSDGIAVRRLPVRAPVVAIVTLTKATENRLTPLPRLRATLELSCAMAVLGKAPRGRNDALAFADAVAAAVPAFELRFSHRDGAFWQLIDAAIGGRA